MYSGAREVSGLLYIALETVPRLRAFLLTVQQGPLYSGYGE